MSFLRSSMVAIGVWMLLCPSALQAAPSRLSASVAPFVVSGGTFSDRQQAAAFSDVLFGRLRSSMSVRLEWVERTDLHAAEHEVVLAQGGALSHASALRLGSWTGADILLSGVFSHEETECWLLTIEFIDLAHADVIASRTLRLPQSADGSLSASEEYIDSTYRTVAQAVSDVELSFRDARGRVAIAPLCFLNEMPGTRLDFFSRDLRESFAGNRNSVAGIRFTSFPRAAESAEESALHVMGLLAQDGTRRSDLADVYVWGTFCEQYSQGVPFSNVCVVASISLWDGASSFLTFTRTNTVKNLSVLALEIVDEAARRGRSLATGAETCVRSQIAKQLKDDARRIQDLIVRTDSAWMHISEPWLRHWNNALDLLAMAVFINPTSPELHFEWLFERTRVDVNAAHPFREVTLWRLLERSSAWREFCEHYGYDCVMHTHISTPWSLANDLRQDQRNSARAIYLSSVEDVMAYLGTSQPELIPDVEREALLEALAAELRRRLFIVARDSPKPLGDEVVGVPEVTTDLRSRARAAELIRPKVCWSSEYAIQKAGELVRGAYAAIREPEQGELLIADASRKLASSRKDKQARRVDPDIRPRSAPGVVFDAVRPDRVYDIPCRKVSFLEDCFVQKVNGLCIEGGRVWTGIYGQRFSCLQSPFIHIYRPSDGTLARLSKLYGSHPMVTTLVADGGRVWVGFDGGGIWSIDTTSLVPTKYTARNGVVLEHVSIAASTGSHIFFAGDSLYGLWVGGFDKATGEWTHYRTPCDSREVDPWAVQSLAATDRRIVAMACRSSSWGLFSCDLTTQKWTDSAPILRELGVGCGGRQTWAGMCGLASDDQSLWFSSGDGLGVFLWTSEVLDHGVRFPGRVTTIYDDGAYLWVACAARSGSEVARRHAHVYLFHKPSRSCLGELPVHATSHISKIARSGPTLWFGCEGNGVGRVTLVSADVAEVDGFGRERAPWQVPRSAQGATEELPNAGQLKEKLLGTWLCNGWVEELSPDGTFRTRKQYGANGSAGRWLVKNGCIVWTFESDQPHIDADTKDVNPVLAINDETFVLKEMNGTLSRHVRIAGGAQSK